MTDVQFTYDRLPLKSVLSADQLGPESNFEGLTLEGTRIKPPEGLPAAQMGRLEGIPQTSPPPVLASLTAETTSPLTPKLLTDLGDVCC